MRQATSSYHPRIVHRPRGRSVPKWRPAVVLAAWLCLAAAGLPAHGDGPATPVIGRKLSAGAKIQATPEQALRAALALVPEAWEPAVNEERARGEEESELYAKFAPAVVVVRSDDGRGRSGHGTGFLVDRDGWILTNRHVVAHCRVDPETGAPMASIHYGTMGDDGFMRISDEPVTAHVYKTSPEKDLALLKLDEVPDALKKLPVMKLAKQGPKVGDDAVVIGHPASGLLWSLREGKVSGFGRFPQDMVQSVMDVLAAAGDDANQLRSLFDNETTRKIVIFSGAINPGNSGSPLLSMKGELLGVAYGGPRNPKIRVDDDGPVIYDTFSYCVHLDEVRAFLEDRPATPLVAVPDPWPAAVYSDFVDIDGDGTPETLYFGPGPGEPATAMLVDLDQDSRLPAPDELTPGALRTAWDFEFAVQLNPGATAFYDTDNDGTIDRVLEDSDNDGKAELVLGLEDGAWRPVKQSVGAALFDPDLMQDQDQRERLIVVLKKLSGK